MHIVTFKCPDDLLKWLENESKERKISKSDLLRRALEFFFSQKGLTSSVSLYSLSKDLCGSLKGPKDLSTNPEHLERYGR